MARRRIPTTAPETAAGDPFEFITDERGGVTVMRDGHPQSHVHPDDPTLLEFEYVQHFALVLDARLRGMKVGSPARWRIEADSVEGYLDDQAEEARRMALWRESNAASFPELWGRGSVRGGD